MKHIAIKLLFIFTLLQWTVCLTACERQLELGYPEKRVDTESSTDQLEHDSVDTETTSTDS